MAFESRGYASDNGFVCRIRQSTQEAAASGGDGGTVDAPFHCLSSGSRRRFGIHARGIRLSRVIGTAPNQFTRNSFLAFPTVAAYDAINLGSTITVGGVAWVASAKVPEASV